ncbi:MAG: hypothetical protein PVJ57_09405 [Phycisphaerae bacterium]|jgi:hypothetical protein
MALSADRDVAYYASAELIDVPVDDDVKIYRNAFVGRNRSTGYARPLVAGDEFLGIAYRAADNTATGHTAGGVSVRLHQGIDVVHTLTGVVLGDVGKDIYASDDETLTLTPAGNSRVGRIVGTDGSGVARVRCQPIAALSGVLEGRPALVLSDANHTLTLDHMNRVLLMGNTVARTLTLPPVATVRAGGWLRVVKTSADAAAITLDGNAAETIDNSATYAAMDARYDCVHLLCTGSEWIILSRDIAA